MENSDNEYMIYVYELYKDGEVFYVGLTKNVGQRLQNHKKTFGQDISMSIVHMTQDVEEANHIEVALISKYGNVLANKELGGGYNPRFYNWVDEEPARTIEEDSFFPLHHSVIRATHVWSIKDQKYVELTHSAKLLFCYMLGKYNFFKKIGCTYFQNQDSIANAVGCSRRTVFSAIKTLQDSGCLMVTSRSSFGQRANYYEYVAEMGLAKIDGDKGTVESYYTNFILADCS